MKIMDLHGVFKHTKVIFGLFFAVALLNCIPEAVASRNSEPKDSAPDGQDQVSEYEAGSRRVYQYVPDYYPTPGTEKQLADISRKAAGKVYYSLKSESGLEAVRVAVVAAVPLSDLKRETEFGRLIAEYLLTDLADRGIQVAELRLGREIAIMAQTGEFILTRNIGELFENYPELDYVVVSTFSNTRSKLIVQGRLVNLRTGVIKSSWRDTLAMNRELLVLFNDPPRPYTIGIKGMEY